MAYAYARNPNLWGFVVTTIKRAEQSEINKTITIPTSLHVRFNVKSIPCMDLQEFIIV